MGVVFSSSMSRRHSQRLLLINQVCFTLAMLLRGWKSWTNSRTTPKSEQNLSNISSTRRCGNALKKLCQGQLILPMLQKQEQILRHLAFSGMSPSPHHHSGDHAYRSEEHTSELQSLTNLVCRLLLENKRAHI